MLQTRWHDPLGNLDQKSKELLMVKRLGLPHEIKDGLVVHEKISLDILLQEESLPGFTLSHSRTPASKTDLELPSFCLIFSGTCNYSK